MKNLLVAQQDMDHAEAAYRTAEALKAPPTVLAKIKAMSEQWDYDYSPEEALQVVFDSYGLKR